MAFWLLAVSMIAMWYCNIQHISINGGGYVPPHQQGVIIKDVEDSGSIAITKDDTPAAVFIPSHNKKYHLKETLSTGLESTISIHVNFSYTIHKDISSYLSFAIIGMSKTGTTSLLKMLSNVTFAIERERCDLVNDDVPLLLNTLYKVKQQQQQQQQISSRNASSRILTGIKCPQDLNSIKSIQNYKKYFYNTKLIVGLRHPILWFESLYNFNVRNMNQMAHTSKLNRCVRGSHGVCAWRSSLSDFLSLLNKTPFGDDEMQFMTLKESKAMRDDKTVGHVFLYEVSQLDEKNTIIHESFRRDLASFLDIEKSLPNTPHISTAGVLDFIPGVEAFSRDQMIDICHDEHSYIRKILLQKAKLSSQWIIQYFIQSTDVHVSSKDYFVKQLETWQKDPCIERQGNLKV